MRDFSDIKDTIYDWIDSLDLVESTSIFRQFQNRALPDKPCFTFMINTFSKIGHDCRVGPDVLGKYQIQGSREFTLMIRGFGDDMVEKTQQLRDSLELDSVLQILEDGGLIPFDTSLPVQDISGLDASSSEERSSYDVLMRTDTIITGVDLGQIATVNAEATYSQPGKLDIIQQLNIDST